MGHTFLYDYELLLQEPGFESQCVQGRGDTQLNLQGIYMKWQKGRQGSGYFKLQLIALSFFDCYFIKIPKGVSVPRHVDIIPGKRHYRLNIDIIKPKIGGVFIGKTIFKLPRITLIRPDIDAHSVTEVFEGHSLILSIGISI